MEKLEELEMSVAVEWEALDDLKRAVTNTGEIRIAIPC
jgi:hypothetical protein